MEKIYLVDAYALIFRAYYALIARPMRNREGLNTSAIFGFTRFLNDLIQREKPHYLAVAFDPKGGNFRHQLYPLYKANRQETPTDIIASVPYVKRILEAMHIPILEVPGYEADDVIGTFSRIGCEVGYKVYMVTPDKDYGQLVNDCSVIYKPRKGSEGIEIVDLPKIQEYYGVSDPTQIIDILALWGDSSDNIPGVPGIGEKSAMKLVQEFGTVENILANTDKLKGKQRENIEANKDKLILAKQLATIDRNVPLEFKPDELRYEEPDYQALEAIYDELDFKALSISMRRMSGNNEHAEKPHAVEMQAGSEAVQQSMFGAEHSPVIKTAEKSGALEFSFDEESQEGNNYETLDTVEHKYIKLTDLAEIRKLRDRLSGLEEFCFDTETDNVDPMSANLVGMSFSYKEFEAYYIPLDNSNQKAVLDILRPVFENKNISKTGQNIKYDMIMLNRNGVGVEGFFYDTMVLDYLMNTDGQHNMDYLSKKYLGYLPIPITDLIGQGSKQITMDKVDVDLACRYACEDADVTLRLKNVLWTKVKDAGLAELYKKIDSPLISVLARMEMAGVRIDNVALDNYRHELDVELQKIEKEIRDIAQDQNMNINSSRQVGELLFDKLNVDSSPKKTKTKLYRTDEEYLQGLVNKHKAVGKILEYRGLKKLLSTYVEALPKLVNPETGRIHTSFNQTVTLTGRLSSSKPNLQNIPIRDDQGREIRRSFIPTNDECLILSADYSQVELRLMATFSQDKQLIEAFAQGRDIHTATAAKVFKVPEADVTSLQRSRAKMVNFGIIYGISSFGLSQRLAIGRREAKEIIDGYFESYPTVKRYMESVVEQARNKGYVETIFGRRSYLKDINSSNAVVRGYAERNAINTPIQGSAADIIKLAMIRLDEQIRSRGLRSKLIIQVHDELVIDMYKPEEAEIVEIVKVAMEDAVELAVKLIVECGVGCNWLEAH